MDFPSAPPSDRAKMDAALLSAHEQGDGRLLADLYQQAALAAIEGPARCFYLTHAMVFALEAGLDCAETIRDQLRRVGAEP